RKSGLQGWLGVLGPGLLYAGAAVGVSHLVQSTRAGAGFGFSLIWVVILANVLKYPFFEAGPRYAAATGHSLIEGYRRLGWFPPVVFVLFTLGTMLAVQAAVTAVTAGLAGYAVTSGGIDTILIGDFDLGRILWGKTQNALGEWEISTWKLSARFLLICGLILAIGRYKVLDRIMKVIIVLLSLTTLLALVFLLVGGIPQQVAPALPFDWGDTGAIVAVVVPLVGWMPAPIDIAIWHSVWSLEKSKADGQRTRLKDALLDFGTGYWGTTLLAVGFLSLGALVMFGSGKEIPASAGAFSRQLIDLYAAALGDWARPVIALAALTTMFSTTLTCLDAFPRVLQRTTEMYLPPSPRRERTHLLYWIWISIVGIGTTYILAQFLSSLLDLVDVATTLSFVTAPLLALFNFLAVTGKDMPETARPGPRLRLLAYLGLGFLFLFALYFLAARFGLLGDL
ncbi:MAG: divalent metal cation transporter, partial [Bacteroidota bacterium]